MGPFSTKWLVARMKSLPHGHTCTFDLVGGQVITGTLNLYDANPSGLDDAFPEIQITDSTPKTWIINPDAVAAVSY